MKFERFEFQNGICTPRKGERGRKKREKKKWEAHVKYVAQNWKCFSGLSYLVNGFFYPSPMHVCKFVPARREEDTHIRFMDMVYMDVCLGAWNIHIKYDATHMKWFFPINHSISSFSQSTCASLHASSIICCYVFFQWIPNKMCSSWKYHEHVLTQTLQHKHFLYIHFF